MDAFIAIAIGFACMAFVAVMLTIGVVSASSQSAAQTRELLEFIEKKEKAQEEAGRQKEDVSMTMLAEAMRAASTQSCAQADALRALAKSLEDREMVVDGKCADSQEAARLALKNAALLPGRSACSF